MTDKVMNEYSRLKKKPVIRMKIGGKEKGFRLRLQYLDIIVFGVGFEDRVRVVSEPCGLRNRKSGKKEHSISVR